MSFHLQNYLVSLVNPASNANLLDLTIRDNFNQAITLNAQEVNTGVVLTEVFLLADFILYAGIVGIILALGSQRRKLEISTLTKLLLKISSFTLYLSLLINLIGFSVGFQYLAQHNLSVFDNAYTFTLFSQIGKIVILLICLSLYSLFASVLLSKMQSLELPLLMQISVALSCNVISSTNFALLLLALEGFSLILYIMTALGRTYGGVTASVKYFAFGTLGSIFLFWGVVHLYALVPSLSFDVINFMLNHLPSESYQFVNAVEFATTAIAFGFMLKLGAAPVHQWVADVYAGSHMYITAFFSILVKFLLFVIFFKCSLYFNADALLKFFILASLIVGCIMSLRQSEIKRLLAYSSIVHVAFLFMGDANSSLTYLITYIVSSLLLFSVLLTAQIAGKELIYLNDLRFLRTSGHFQVLCLIIALASSAGLPPFAGFYGKFLVWSSLIEDIYLTGALYSYITLFLSIFISLATIYYYMRVLAYLFVGEDDNSQTVSLNTWSNSLGNVSIYVQASLCVFVAFWTVFQSYILSIIQHITLSY